MLGEGGFKKMNILVVGKNRPLNEEKMVNRQFLIEIWILEWGEFV